LKEEPTREAFFLPGGQDVRLFALHSAPRRNVRGALLFVHPFAEEMNRARRMVALAVQRFVDDGWAVLQVDLAGCGDSSGTLESTSWEDWLGNVDVAATWLQERYPVPLMLWGLRAGCLILSEWLGRNKGGHPVLYWHPVSSGRQHMSHFLRMKVAGEVPEGLDARAVLQGMRSRLDLGGSVEVAGYTVSASLVKGLEQSMLDFPAAYGGRVCVLEVNSSTRCELSPILASFVNRWRQGGVIVESGVATGPAFWLTQEVTLAPDLIELSREALARLVS